MKKKLELSNSPKGTVYFDTETGLPVPMTNLYCSHTDGSQTHKLEDCPTNFIATAVKEFDKEFPEHTCSEGCGSSNPCFEGVIDKEDAKSFLTTALLQYQAKIREMVEGVERLCVSSSCNACSERLSLKKDLLSNELLNNK